MVVFAEFDFDKDPAGFIAHDEVDFTTAALEVSGTGQQAMAAEKLLGHGFVGLPLEALIGLVQHHCPRR